MCRIRNETTPTSSYQPANQSSNNKGNKKGGSKSPLAHYPHHGQQQQRYGRDEHHDQSPERSTQARVKSQASTSLRRNQNHF